MRTLAVVAVASAFVAKPTVAPLKVLGFAPRSAMKDAETKPKTRRKSSMQDWDVMYGELSSYRSTWGTADAPLGDELGRWCEAQRRLKKSGKLAADRADKLDLLKFAWTNLSQLTPEELEARWQENVEALVAYVAAHGDAQVPKNGARIPCSAAGSRRAAGAATSSRGPAPRPRRGGLRVDLEPGLRLRVHEGLPKYRDWRVAAAAGAAPPDDLAVWVAATKAAAAKGKLSAERLDYLGSVAFFETGGGVDDAAFLDDA
ncbi:hypothetical protein JL720_9145 [Aureococcus anophagefferens]|nr:hypothetical protein JL720_9145 [Aureococcus anophagefferens]